MRGSRRWQVPYLLPALRPGNQAQTLAASRRPSSQGPWPAQAAPWALQLPADSRQRPKPQPRPPRAPELLSRPRPRPPPPTTCWTPGRPWPAPAGLPAQPRPDSAECRPVRTGQEPGQRGPRACPRAEASRGAILTTGAMAAAEAEREVGALRRRKEPAARRARRTQAVPMVLPRPSAAAVSPCSVRSGSDCFSPNAKSVLSQA